MALFKLRKKVDAPRKAAAAPAESVETMRRRARHRLIGAVVLVLAGVVGFPILFDTQPRPVAVDIPIEIPDRNKAKPLAPLPAAPGPVAAGKVSPPASAPLAVAKAEPREEILTESKPRVVSDPPKLAAKAASAPERKPEAKVVDEAAKARALLEGRSLDDGGRFVVQVGAFAEEAKALHAQQKLERAGLRNYRQVADTEEGKRIRVRAGPFASRAEADKAAEKIKGLDLPVRVLTL